MDSTSNPLASLPPQLQDIIQLALSAFIKESLNPIYILILSSLWLGVSFSLFVALLYSSNPISRRTPLFWISLIAIGFGTVPSILFIKLLVQSFAKAVGATTEFIKPYIFALSFFTFFSSICVDSILLLRIVAVFPPARMSRQSIAAVFGPLLLVKVGRIVTAIAVVFHFMKFSETVPPDHPQSLYPAAAKLPEPRAAWSLQLVDNAICSFLFLYRLNQMQSFSTRLGRNKSYFQWLRSLFLIAISNFVFPVIFVIIQLSFMARETDISYLTMACLNISGTNIEVIGVLFATIWSAQLKDNWKNGVRESKSDTVTHEIVFGQSSSAATVSDIENGHTDNQVSMTHEKPAEINQNQSRNLDVISE